MFRLLFLIFLVTLGCKSTTSTVSNSSGIDDLALFTVNNTPISTKEFIHVYKKNNVNNDSAYTQTDIKNYLDLYIKFKLKIEEAKALGMDTTATFLNEFNSYKDELKKPYLTENKVTQKLMAEAYGHYQQEVRAAHILVNVKNVDMPSDTLLAYNKAMELRNEILAGADFSIMAKKHSDDPSAKNNGGDLGYFTAFQMVYPFEKAAFSTPVGEVSMPVKTQFGYHLVKVKDKRPSNGKVQVAHIMLRTKADTLQNRNKIFEIYEQVIGGVDWNELVKLHTEDINSRNTNGILRPFSVAQMPLEFQEAAFALNEEGDISDPVQTQYGWHIIKLIKKEPIETYEQMLPVIKSRIEKDSRANLNKKAFIARLKKENGFKSNVAIETQMLARADSSLLKGSWTKPQADKFSDQVLFQIGDQKFTVGNFYEFVVANQKANSKSPQAYFKQLYSDYQDEQLLAYEEAQLESKYFDYKMIVKEYREGILLFELMEREIWNRAVEDTLGLKQYFDQNKEQYMWDKRAEVSIYTAKPEILSQIEKAIGKNDSVFLESKNLNETFNSANKEQLKIEEGLLEPQNNELLSIAQWKIGIQQIEFAGKTHLIWIKALHEPQIKELYETKGAVISDYQNHLENIWVEKLKQKYAVLIDNSALNHVYQTLENERIK